MRNEIWTIQAMRAVAAAMVVLHHAIRAFGAKADAGATTAPWFFADVPQWNFLVIGVDLFFVISGFIMVHTTPQKYGAMAAFRFLVRRVIRIYPLWWMALMIPIAGALAAYWKSGYVDAYVLSWHRIVSSILLFPSMAESGHLQPIVGVGWTLSYEMLFYLAFAVALMLGRRTALIAGALLVTVLMGAMASGSSADLISFLANPIYLEFIFGMALGAAWNAGRLPKMSIWLGVVAIVAAVIIGAQVPEDSSFRFVCMGVPACTVIWCALSLAGTKPWAGAVRLGGASYAMYLFHMPVIFWLVLKPALLVKIGLNSPLLLDFYILASVALSVIVGCVLHALVERPVQSALVSSIFGTAKHTNTALEPTKG
ncbi:hypothetical protein DBR42_08235 [Pelomonas sp. HMWF004]|nr:hypothetical protein DBR42_08235 [Pelomonas sp. HMWF004]